MFKKLFELYRDRYYISPLDLADYAETNRLHLFYISPIIFLFGIINLPLFLFLYRNNLSQHIMTYIYYGMIAVIAVYMFIHSALAKNVSREKAYFLKNIPFYIGFLFFLATGIMSVYGNQPFNGFVTFILTNIIALYLFSFSPFFFLFCLIVVVSIIAPGLFASFGLSGFMNVCLTAVLFFCLALYKRRSEKKIIMLLKKQKQSLEAKTFGNFTLMYNNTVIKFNRTKSQELMAYLIYKNGSSVKTKELITALYGRDADTARYGASIRNLIVDIKHTLAELEIQNFFIAEYNNFRINPEVINCDYYDFLAGNKKAVKNFAGEFMSQYGWAKEVSIFMEYKVLKNKL